MMASKEVKEVSHEYVLRVTDNGWLDNFKKQNPTHKFVSVQGTLVGLNETSKEIVVAIDVDDSKLYLTIKEKSKKEDVEE